MPTQDEIIQDTEVVFEEWREGLNTFKEITPKDNCCTILENILFELIVILYT